jgi:ATP-dependent RNA helicase RhlE
VEQTVQWVDKGRKRELLAYRIGNENWRQVLVFARTKHGASRLAEQLVKDGLSATAIHGNKSQGARTRALDDFKNGRVRVLVATDIAARGLDIDKLPHVVNFELPNVPEDYIHRIGRTARAGEDGEALSLVCAEERDLLRDVERLLKTELPRVTTPGFEFTENSRTRTLEPPTRSASRQSSGASGHRRPSTGSSQSGSYRSAGNTGRGRAQSGR